MTTVDGVFSEECVLRMKISGVPWHGVLLSTGLKHSSENLRRRHTDTNMSIT
jgi:hypothetical protein